MIETLRNLYIQIKTVVKTRDLITRILHLLNYTTTIFKLNKLQSSPWKKTLPYILKINK